MKETRHAKELLAQDQGIQVVFVHEALLDHFINWLGCHDLHLFQMPIGRETLPTYGVTPGEERMARYLQVEGC